MHQVVAFPRAMLLAGLMCVKNAKYVCRILKIILLIALHANKSISEATKDSTGLFYRSFDLQCVCTAELCVVSQTLDHYQGLSCAPVPLEWATWARTAKELRVDQYAPAMSQTHRHAQTHVIWHRMCFLCNTGSLYLSFIIGQTLDDRMLLLFSLL